METRADRKYLQKKRMTPKEIYEDIVLISDEDSSSNSTVKKEFAKFQRSTAQHRHSFKNWTIDKLVDAIHRFVLYDRHFTVQLHRH